MDRIIQDNTEELCVACIAGNIKVVEEILSNKEVNINAPGSEGDTPLTCCETWLSWYCENTPSTS